MLSYLRSTRYVSSFITVPAAFGVQSGEISEASAALTQYRRRIRRPNEDDEKCYVVFNDYMNCLFGDPTEEKEKAIIDIAAALGCEYYCLDAGWYDDGFWWDRVGEWKEKPNVLWQKRSRMTGSSARMANAASRTSAICWTSGILRYGSTVPTSSTA